MDNTPYFTKKPAEELSKGFDFTGKLATGVTVVSGTASAISVHDGEDASEILDSAEVTVADGGLSVIVLLVGGSPNIDYEIALALVLSDDSKPIYSIVMQCRD